MSPTTKDKKGSHEEERKVRSAAEVTTLAVCAVIVGFLLFYSLYHALITGDSPPRLTATPLLREVTKRGSLYVLPVEIRNDTRPTAEDVMVTVKVIKNGQEVEDKEISIPYLPERSSQKAYVTLKERPTKETVLAEIESYKLP